MSPAQSGRRGRGARAAAAALALAAGAGAIVAYGTGVAGAGTRAATLASFTERDVAVQVVLRRDSAGHDWLEGRFTPTRAGFHLYGKDLPREGIHGIGRPTRLDVGGSPALHAAGPLTADRPEQTLDVPLLGLRFPVYPAGAVTLRQPVMIAAGPGGGAEVSVTYMACSEHTCLAPAIDRRVHITLPEAR